MGNRIEALIAPNDVRFDTFLMGVIGIPKVRLTHIPTGIVIDGDLKTTVMGELVYKLWAVAAGLHSYNDIS